MIAVTGAYGFIGSRLLSSLSEKYAAGDLLAVDHASSFERRRVKSGRSFTFMSHYNFLDNLQGGALNPDVIMHMGACSDTTVSDWDYLRKNNLEYSQILWNWCAQAGKRLIYASSAATYGDGSNGFDDETNLELLKPLNLYGRSKHEFDLWVKTQELGGGPKPVQCVGFKFFNVFGPGESHKGRMASMVFHSFQQIRSTGRVKLFKSHRPDFTDGGQLRDFIYVDVVVDMLLQCLKNHSISGLFNLGTGKARSFRDLAIATFHALKLTPQIDYIPMPEDLQGKYQYFTEAAMSKAARAGLNLRRVSLEEAVALYVTHLCEEEQSTRSAAA